MLQKSIKADTLGCITSILCLIHCSITPILFMTWTSSTAQINNSHNWWHLLDYLFLIFSFVAIYSATKKITKKLIKVGFWSSWLLLLVIILNEKLAFATLSESLIYLPTFSIIFLHTYNLVYPFVVKNSQITIKPSI